MGSAVGAGGKGGSAPPLPDSWLVGGGGKGGGGGGVSIAAVGDGVANGVATVGGGE